MIGIPSEEEIISVESPVASFMLKSVTLFQRVRLKELCKDGSADALDFMKHCTRFNPRKRVSADLALQHPLVANFLNAEDENSCCEMLKVCSLV